MGRSKIRYFLETIKFEHSLFALPFAYLGLILAERGWPSLRVFFWVTLAMVGLRTVGMIANRLSDQSLDQKNPRTSNWPFSKGLITKRALVVAQSVSTLIYFVSAWALNPLCFKLSPIPFILVFAYPLMKRFTWVTHLFLGGILAIAPMGGWIASQGAFSLEPLALVFSVLFWVAGFDILYALQDEDFDRKEGLFSIPSKFGKRTSLIIAFGFHLICLASLIVLGLRISLGAFYWSGVALGAFLIITEHLQLKDRGVSWIPKIFFMPNAAFSAVILLGTLLDLVTRSQY